MADTDEQVTAVAPSQLGIFEGHAPISCVLCMQHSWAVAAQRARRERVQLVLACWPTAAAERQWSKLAREDCSTIRLMLCTR